MKGEIMNTIQKLSGRARSAIVPFAILAVWVTNGPCPGLAQQSAQPTFPSAEQASQNLFQAMQREDGQSITNILGGPAELASSRDEAQDKTDRELFVQKYQEMHRLGREPDGSVTLYIGAENWPFPIPLVAKNGAWRFDPDAGQKEVLFRRVGENELTAIMTCHEFVAAERQFSAKAKAADPTDSSPASLVAKAASGSNGSNDPVLLYGYYFRVLTTHPTNGTSQETKGKMTDGFALIAYPAEYRSSGVMTFVVTGKDVVYEKDLGPNTSTVAGAMTSFHKDATWHAAAE
jgi:hypothetical protein